MNEMDVRTERRGLSQRAEPVLCQCGQSMPLVRHEGQPPEIADQNKRTHRCSCGKTVIVFEDVNA
jgi:CDGSH-type Zn-finger protein